MTDKIQKIKEWISKEQDGLMDAQGNFEYPEHEGAYHILCNLDAYIDSLQEEPSLSNKQPVDEAMAEIERKAKLFTEANKGKTSEEILAEMRGEEPVSNPTPSKKMSVERWKRACEAACCDTNYRSHFGLTETRDDYFVDGVQWADEHPKEEPVSDDLGECINELSKQFPEVSFAKLSRIAVRVAKWQKEKLWKPADGDDLPEYDREVIAILDYYDFGHYKVVYAHRPNPDGWNGTNIDTEEKEHFEPVIYDKGGWNQPHILYWLDARLPYEEKEIDKK